MKVKLAQLINDPAYGIGLVVEYADQYNFTVFAGGTTWKYQSGIDADGNKYWYLNGKRHRTDGPAVVYAGGTTEWFLNGKRHRTDGPAIVYASLSEHWFLNGKRHRTDGPAAIYSDGGKYWYLNDKGLSEAEWEALTSS